MSHLYRGLQRGNPQNTVKIFVILSPEIRMFVDKHILLWHVLNIKQFHRLAETYRLHKFINF